MQVSATTEPGGSTEADTVAIGVFDGEDPPGRAPAQLGELLLSGEARRSFKSLAVVHAEGKRWVVVGLGARDAFTPERARVAAAVVSERARELSVRALCWETPPGTGGEVAGGLVEGT